MWIQTGSTGRANGVPRVHDKQVLTQMRSRAFQMAGVCTAMANIALAARLAIGGTNTDIARHTRPTPCTALQSTYLRPGPRRW
jgi:hypothetical protein